MNATNATRTPKKLSASIGPKLLANSTKYFDKSIESVVRELVQNARRAGATTVTLAVEGDTLAFRDDGRGLGSEAAAVLLTLGGSDNDATLDAAEDAAGIGFFSIGSYDVEVRSRDWRMDARKEVFTGKAEATLEEGLDCVVGLEIRIAGIVEVPGMQRADDAPAHPPRAIALAAMRATLHSGMTCVLLDLPRQSREDARNGRDGLRGATPPTLARQVLTPVAFLDDLAVGAESWEDVEVPGATLRLVRRSVVRYGVAEFVGAVNFHGHVLPLESCGELAEAIKLALPQVETVATVSGTAPRRRIGRQRVRNEVYVDVRSTATLRLKLPDRTAVVADRGVGRLADAATRAYVALLRRPGVVNGLPLDSGLRTLHPRIPGPSVPVSRACGGGTKAWIHETSHPLMGVSTPDGRRVLVDAEGREVDVDDVVGEEGSVGYLQRYAVEEPDGVVDDEDLARALGADRRSVKTLSLTFREAGIETETPAFGVEDFTYEDFPQVLDGDPNLEVEGFGRAFDDVELRITSSRPGKPDRDRVVELAGFAWSPDGNTTNPTIVVSRKHGEGLVARMLEAIDWYSDECDTDSRDVQEEDHTSEWELGVATILGRSEEVVMRNLHDAIGEHVRDLLAGRDDLDRIDLAVKVVRENGARWGLQLSIACPQLGIAPDP